MTRLSLRPAPLALAMALACAATPLLAQNAGMPQADTPMQLGIAAKPLAQALGDWAVQTRIQLIVQPALVAGKTGPAVSGTLTPWQALERLLAGSGLVAVPEGRAVVVKPAPVGPATSLAPVTVTASVDRERAEGPVLGYVARRSASGTKTDTPLIETPQSISVIGAEELEVRKADSLMAAIGYTAGIGQSLSRGAGGTADGTNDSFSLRGFEMDPQSGNYYRDGAKYTVNPYNGRQEPYGLERVEILKGAASVLYGTAAPGGIINTVSKRPTTETLRELNVSAGSFHRVQASGDFGGALTEDGTWSYRLTALQREGDSFIDYMPDDRTFLAPALRWQPAPGTALTLLAEYQHDRAAAYDGLPASGTLLPNPNGRIPRTRFVGQPGYDRFDLTRYTIGYLFEHAPDDRFKLRHSLRYFKADNHFDTTWIWGLAADQRTTLERGAQNREDRSAAIVADTSLQSQWTTGNIAHTVLAGFDISRQRHESERYDRSAPALDLYAPVYGGALGEPAPSAFSWQERRKQFGVYIQDQMKIAERWVVLLGGRHDSVRYDEKAFFTPDVTADNEKSRATTGRAGLVYLAPNGLAPFASFSQSFVPLSGTDRLGQRFKPTRGAQWEAGVRYQPAGSDTLLTAAVYALTRTNSLVGDPQNPSFSIQHGEVRSRGLELEAKTRLGLHANLIAAYAYTDARTVKSSSLTPEQEGRRSVGVPYHQLALWGDYSFGAFDLPGLKVGMGMRHVGATHSAVAGVDVPAFTLFDAMVSYATGPWRFALNVSNVADRTYVAQCSGMCFYGEPRKATATATYRW